MARNVSADELDLPSCVALCCCSFKGTARCPSDAPSVPRFFLGNSCSYMQSAFINSVYVYNIRSFSSQHLNMAHDEPEHLCRCLTETALGSVQPSLQQFTPDRTEFTRLTPRGVLEVC